MRDRRRVRSQYLLPLRAYGNTIRHVEQIDDIRAVLPTIALIIQNFNWLQPNWPVLHGIVRLLLIYHDRTKIVIIIMTVIIIILLSLVLYNSSFTTFTIQLN